MVNRELEHRVTNIYNDLVAAYENDELREYIDRQVEGNYEIVLDSAFEFKSSFLFFNYTPNITLDTQSQNLEANWGDDYYSVSIDSDICDEIDNYFAELYEEFR